MNQPKSTKVILSLEKALNIIEILSNSELPMRLQDIAAAADIPASTALRLIYTLQSRGYIKQEPASSRYYLSLKLFSIGSRISDNLSISDIARPQLKMLASRLSHSVNLAISQDNLVFIIDVVGGSSESHNITTRPGRTVPLHCTALGRALMIDYTLEQLDEYLSFIPLTSYTPLTVRDRNSLWQELEKVKEKGYAFDPGEFRPGIIGVGAPILNDSGHPVASISIAELSSVSTPEMVREFAAAAMETAQKISAML